MKDYIALISVGAASDKFHYVLDNKSMDTKTAMLHLIDTVGMSIDNAEDYLAALPEKWFHDMEAFLADPKAEAKEESCPYCTSGILRKTVVSMEMMSPDGPVPVPDIDCEECDYCGNISFDKEARQYIDRFIKGKE